MNFFGLNLTSGTEYLMRAVPSMRTVAIAAGIAANELTVGWMRQVMPSAVPRVIREPLLQTMQVHWIDAAKVATPM